MNPDYHAWITSDFLLVVWLSLTQQNKPCTLTWSFLCQVFNYTLANSQNIYLYSVNSNDGIFILLYFQNYLFLQDQYSGKFFQEKNTLKVCSWKMFIFKCFESSFFLNARHFAKDIMQFCNNKPYMILGGLKLKPCIESDNFVYISVITILNARYFTTLFIL